VDGRPTYPLRLEGRLEGEPSRWLWLVKWLLAIPHYIVLAFLWIAVFVLTVVAFFAILFTTRYPRGIFDFNLGVLRWTWRVAFYSYGALGTDRYPPFSLGEEPEYPATLDVAYPEQLSRGLVLVKWWLLAIPHYLVLGLLLGGGSAAGRAGHWHWGWGWGWTFSTGLIGVLVLFVGVALLFTTRYPRGLFDLVLGFDRWVARVAAYVGLMTDAYPPFRLDQGGEDAPVAPPEAPAAPAAATAAEPEPAAPAAAAPGRSGAGRVALLVLGTVAALIALVTLVGGTAIVAIDRTQRDDDGFLMSPTEDFSTSTYAIVSESADVETEGADWAVKAFLGTVRIRSESERPVFVGIAREADAAPYVDAIERDVVTGIGDEPRYSRKSGSQPTGPPGELAFWAASSSGAGEQTLEWEPEDGSWTVVAMNADASRGVSTELSIGAELDSVLWIGIGLLVFGALLAAAAALAITAGVRRRV
jgi:hypothetical protein